MRPLVHHAASLLAASLLATSLLACAGHSTAPAAMPTLSSLRDEPERRDQQLDSAAARRHEGRAGKRDKLYQVETVAATAAAIVGTLFSTSANVIIGVAAGFDEDAIIAPGEADRAHDDLAQRPKEELHACPGSLLLQRTPCPAPAAPQ